MLGPERYSRYSGYGDTFKWDGNLQDDTPHDEYGRRRTSICIIDATHFNKPLDQFYPSAILRELNKVKLCLKYCIYWPHTNFLGLRWVHFAGEGKFSTGSYRELGLRCLQRKFGAEISHTVNGVQRGGEGPGLFFFRR